MKVVHAVYNGSVCNDSVTIETIGISPFSTIFMCSDRYEMKICLPDNSTMMLYKNYNTPFCSIVQAIAVFHE